MSAEQLTIKTDLSLIIHSLEDQLYPPSSPGFSNLELPPVDHQMILPHGSHHTGQGRFYTERNPDLLSQYFRCGFTPSFKYSCGMWQTCEIPADVEHSHWLRSCALISLVEPYYAGAKVYAITTHLKACVVMA